MKALVVGAGVAGPVAAMALQQVGIEAEIVEAWPRPEGETGSYFTLTPNGLDALDAVGALHLAREIGFATRRNVMRGRKGQVVGDLPLGEPLADGTPALTMKRSRLAVALAQEAERRGIPVTWGRRLTGATSEGGRVVASYGDGTSSAADLLIGCDGVHSVVRRLVDLEAPAARYVGLTNFGGLTPADRLPAAARDLEPETWQFWFGSRAFFGAHRTPGGDVVWFLNDPRPPVTGQERAATTAEQWRERLAARFDGDPGPAAALVRAGELELAGDNTHDLGHVPRWHRDRMVVIGDAAHAPAPSSGQGASMALEDAVVLARSLGEHAGVEDAFAAYERARRKRVERVVAHGARSSSAKVPGRVGSVVRDGMLRLVLRHVVTERSLAWMYGHRIEEPARS